MAPFRARPDRPCLVPLIRWPSHERTRAACSIGLSHVPHRSASQRGRRELSLGHVQHALLAAILGYDRRPAFSPQQAIKLANGGLAVEREHATTHTAQPEPSL